MICPESHSKSVIEAWAPNFQSKQWLFQSTAPPPPRLSESPGEQTPPEKHSPHHANSSAVEYVGGRGATRVSPSSLSLSIPPHGRALAVPPGSPPPAHALLPAPAPSFQPCWLTYCPGDSTSAQPSAVALPEGQWHLAFISFLLGNPCHQLFASKKKILPTRSSPRKTV